MAKYIYSGSFFTDAGEKDNQDSFLLIAKKPAYLGVVADGVGGLSFGDVASDYVIGSIEKWFDDISSEPDSINIQQAKYELEKVIVKIHDDLLDIGVEKAGTLGSTLTLCLIVDKRYFICQIGDSRAYLYDGEEIKQITVDQTVAEYERQHNVEFRHVPAEKKESTLMQCLGFKRNKNDFIKPEYYEGELPKTYGLLICSDGLSNTLSNKTIASHLSQQRPCKDILMTLTALARENGEDDNITSVLMRRIKRESDDEQC